jgi:hypothetical protein
MPAGRRAADTRLTIRPARVTLTVVNGTPDHVLRHRSAWDLWAADYAAAGQRNWSAAEASWGI